MKYRVAVALLSLLLIFSASRVLGSNCWTLTYGTNDGPLASCEVWSEDEQCQAYDPNVICEWDICSPNMNDCGAHHWASYAYCILIDYFCEYPGCRNIQCA